MKKATVVAVLAVFVFALCFTACDDFFSKSWGSSRTYDASKIDINSKNKDDWLNAAIGNPALADAIIKAIDKKLKDGSIDPAEKAILLDTGVKLAVESSQIGTSMLTRAAEILGNADNLDPDTVKELLDKIQKDFNTGGGPSAAENIAQMVNDSISDDEYPKFDDNYANLAQPGDVAQAIMVLTLGFMGENSVSSDNWDNITDLTEGLTYDSGHIVVVVDGDPSDSALAMAAYLNLVADNCGSGGAWENNPLTSAIYDAFFTN